MDRLICVAGSVPGLRVLQISVSDEQIVDDPRFERAYPLWTMVHDGTTWPQQAPALLVELGPSGTFPAWRGRGVCSALLASVLAYCRENGLASITLTVDGESPTHAQNLYLKHGFRVTERLIAYQVRL